MNKFRLNFSTKKLVVLTTLFTLNLCNTSIMAAGDFKSYIQYPDLTDGKAFGLNTNSSHKLLFFTGKKDDKSVNGYFRSSHFLGWTKHNFHPLEPYTTNSKRIVAVTDGPANYTVVLSHVDGHGQLISVSNDGKDWETKRILVAEPYFDHLSSTFTSGMHAVLAYSSKRSSYILSHDSMNWYSDSLPVNCKATECSFENKYLGDDGADKLVLLQTIKGFEDTNVLYHSRNYHQWYQDEVPFNHETIQQVFKTQHNLMAVSTLDKDGNHKLWLTHDLSNWKNFDLPKDATLTDLSTANKRIEMLLVHHNNVVPDCPAPPTDPVDHDGCKDKPAVNVLVTDYSYLDAETNTIHLIQQFNGEISQMKNLDGKLYLIGNVTNNKDNKHSILIGGSV